MSTRFLIDTPATIDESGGGDLSHPVNQSRCEASVQPRDELLRAAHELGVNELLRCSRPAKHWTHVFLGDGEPFPEGRMRLCTQHYKMIERRRELGAAAKYLMLWKGQRA